MSKEKAIVKFNGSKLALLCSKCRVIIKTGKDFTEEELKFVFEKGQLLPRYCEKCKSN
jgi:NAD-dependent SIR2 family protein deacetylase